VFASGDALSTNSCTLTGLFERSSAVMAWLDRVVPNRAR
jgi:hypothetical protein